MKTINYKEDYFNTLLSGEGPTISWAEAVSVFHLGQTGADGTSLVIRFDETDSKGASDPELFSVYSVRFISGKYFIVNQAEERLAHGLGKVISEEYKEFARSGKSFQWWSSLLIEDADGTLALSDLAKELRMPVCDEVMIPFTEFMEELNKLVVRWKILAGNSFSSVILSSSEPAFTSLPVRFAIQQVFGCRVYLLPEGALENIDPSEAEGHYLIPKGILDKDLSLSPAVSVAEVIKEGSVSFMTPVDDNFSLTAILGGITLGDLFGETPKADFTAGSISLKRVALRIGKTGYGKVVLSAEGGMRLIAGTASKNSDISIVASSASMEEENTLPENKTPGDEGLRLKGFSLGYKLASNGKIGSMSDEQLLEEKENVCSALDFDVITVDTNIFLRSSTREDGTSAMHYAPMILSLAKLQQKKDPSGCGFEVNSAVQEELYRFQCGKVSDDSAWERSAKCRDIWGDSDKIALKENARRAVRMLDSMASQNQVCSSPDAVPTDGKVYADPFILKRCLEIISEGKSLMLITDDTDLRYKVKVAAQRYCAAHPEARKPAVLTGRNVFGAVSTLHRIEKELSSREVSVAC